MSPDWLNDSVQAFGRQMGLQNFRLQENGCAGATFENGLVLRFEYAQESLLVTMGVALEATDEAMKRLLVAAHPSAAGQGARVRAGYLARRGEALFALRLGEREVTVSALEAAFRVLWAAADRLRRAAS